MVNRAAKIDVVGTGFVVLDRIYEDDQKAFEALGGSCANVLWSLAMLDRQVTPVLRLGADEVGELLVAQFEHAGADTRFIARQTSIASPILVQFTDTQLGTHSFSFLCPDTNAEFPRYQPIDHQEVDAAAAVIEKCAVFYADRLSEAIVLAMETVSLRRGIVFFEPSEISDRDLFDRAIDCATIIKFSSDRFTRDFLLDLTLKSSIVIMTHGAKGLEVGKGAKHVWSDAITISEVKDTSGSGDMVSVGLIYHLVETGLTAETVTLLEVLKGVHAGQRLAAANCSFLGARGLFEHRSRQFALSILHEAIN
jgi:fructokinase